MSNVKKYNGVKPLASNRSAPHHLFIKQLSSQTLFCPLPRGSDLTVAPRQSFSTGHEQRITLWRVGGLPQPSNQRGEGLHTHTHPSNNDIYGP